MYLFFDTETTGFPKSWKAPVTDTDNWPRLVQAAWLLYDQKGEQVSSANYIIKPDGYSIPAEATKIHGITTDQAKQEGVPVAEALQNLQSSLEQSDCLVAHNINFDEKVLGAEFLRAKMPNGLKGKQKICTMKTTADFCGIPGKYGYKWPKLEELHEELFDTTFEEAHNAAVDIRATAKCFWELKRLDVI